MRRVIIFVFIGILMTSLVSAGIIDEVVDLFSWQTKMDTILDSGGIDGITITNFNIDGNTYNEIKETKDNIEIETKYTNLRYGTKQDIWIRNKQGVGKVIDVVMTVEIDYNEVRWAGQKYKLTSTPTIFDSWIEEGNLQVPNIFMGKENKRINYRDIAEKGGYATGYESGGNYYIDFRIDSLSLKANEEYYIDPTFTNATTGFDISTAGAANAAGLATNGTDFWTVDATDDWVYHFNIDGTNITDGNSTTALTAPSPFKLSLNTTTNSFWVYDDGNGGMFSMVDGVNDSGGFTTLGITGQPVTGLDANATDIYLAGGGAVSHVKGIINQTGAFDITMLGNPQGLAIRGSELWVADVNGSIFNYALDGTIDDSDSFNTVPFGVGNLRGMASDGIDLWVIDTTDAFIYHLEAEALFSIRVNLDSPTNNSVETKGDDIVFNATLDPLAITLTNSTLFIYNSTDDLVNQSLKLLDGSTNVTSYNVNDLIADTYLWNIQGCGTNGTDGFCSFNGTNRTLTIQNFDVVSEVWTANTYETQNETFELNITVVSSIQSLSANLNYNGSSFPGTETCVGTACSIQIEIDLPLVRDPTVNSHNKSFFWEITLFDGESSSTISQNTTAQEQNVTKINFVSCGTGAEIINYTIHNETDRSLMSADFSAGFQFFLGSGDVQKNFSVSSTTDSSFDFCMLPVQPNNLTMKVSSRIELKKGTFATRLYDFIRISYTNVTTIQPLFLLNSSAASNIIIEVKDQGLTPLPDIVVNISKYFTDVNRFIQVERRLTEDFGTFVAKLIENDATYMFEFFDLDGNLLKTIPRLTVACRLTACVIPIVIETKVTEFDDFKPIASYSSELTFSNATNTFIFSWDDKRGEGASTRFEVIRYLLNGTETVCDLTSTSQLSVLSCPVGDLRASYKAQAFRTASTGSNAGREIRISVLNVKVGEIFSIFGREGLLWVFLLLFTGLGIGAFNPSVGAAIYGMGFIAFGILGIISMPISVFFANTIIVGIFIWAVRS